MFFAASDGAGRFRVRLRAGVSFGGEIGLFPEAGERCRILEGAGAFLLSRQKPYEASYAWSAGVDTAPVGRNDVVIGSLVHRSEVRGFLSMRIVDGDEATRSSCAGS